MVNDSTTAVPQGGACGDAPVTDGRARLTVSVVSRHP